MSAWFRSFANRQGQIEPRRFRKPRQGGENGDESRMHAAGCGELRRLGDNCPVNPTTWGVQLSLHCFMILNGYNCTTMTINSYKLGYGPPITMVIQLGQPWLYRYFTVVL